MFTAVCFIMFQSLRCTVFGSLHNLLDCTQCSALIKAGYSNYTEYSYLSKRFSCARLSETEARPVQSASRTYIVIRQQPASGYKHQEISKSMSLHSRKSLAPRSAGLVRHSVPSTVPNDRCSDGSYCNWRYLRLFRVRFSVSFCWLDSSAYSLASQF